MRGRSLNTKDITVLGAGIQGTCAALCLAERGHKVVLVDREDAPLLKASLWNEGKIHLGYLFANDDSSQTARMMMRGAEKFLPMLSRFIATRELVAYRSKPFVYAVPRDSLLPVSALERHFSEVSEELSRRHIWDGRYLGIEDAHDFYRLSKAELEEQCDDTEIQAAFQTQEASIDTFRIAQALRKVIWQHPNIEFLPNATVETVQTTQNHRERTFIQKDGKQAVIDADIVVNALWSDLLRINAEKNIPPQTDFSFRYKLALHAEDVDYPTDIKSITLMLGAYGDLVAFPDGRMYLSWYPSCLQASGSALQPPRWDLDITDATKDKVRYDILRELSARLPNVANIDLEKGRVAMEGGFIFSWGSGRISDLSDQVHKRVDIGITRSGNFFSIDTGKYGMAPLFAEQLTDMISGAV